MQDPATNPYQAPSTESEQLVDAFLDKRLTTAATGMKLMYVGILLILLACIFGAPGTLLSAGSRVVTILMSTLGLVGFLLVNLGPLSCTTVPSGIGLRSFAVTTVVAQFVSITLALPQVVRFVVSPWFAIAALLCAVFASTMFLIFLYRTAKYIRRPDLVRQARNVFLIAGIVISGTLAVAFFVDSNDMGTPSLIAIVASVFAFTLLFVAYANVVNAVSDAIRTPGKVRRYSGLA